MDLRVRVSLEGIGQLKNSMMGVMDYYLTASTFLCPFQNHLDRQHALHIMYLFCTNSTSEFCDNSDQFHSEDVLLNVYLSQQIIKKFSYLELFCLYVVIILKQEV